MRTIPSSLQTALDNPNGVKLSSRLRIYRNRIFLTSSQLNTTYTIPGARTAGIFADTPNPQDCRFDASLNKVVTVFNNDTGYQMMPEGIGQVSTIETTILAGSRPTVIPPYVYYQKADGSLVRDIYSYTYPNFTVTETQVISSAANKPGSLFGIDDSNAIHIYIDEGGVGITHYKRQTDGTWTANVWAGRIMFPNEVWTASSKAIRLNYATAAKNDKGVFIYLSSPNGEVIGIQLFTNGIWSDTFTAFPKDLSNFYISNSAVDEYQRIHLCGQFIRQDNWNTGYAYNMSLWSDNGEVFSTDRFTLFSTLGYRFMLALGRSKVIFCDMNRIAELDPTYAYYRENANSITITENIAISGTTVAGWDITIGNGDSKYTDSSLLAKQNLVKFDLGILENGVINWQLYDTTIISKIEKITANGARGLHINLISEGLWRASSTTYPFGMELQSKQSVRDDVEAMDNLSTAANSHGIKDPFCVTLSTVENPFGAQGKPANTNAVDWYSGDLISKFYLEEYPEITEFPLTIKLFGWSRIGNWDESASSPDNTDSSLPNDSFTPLFIVEDEDGDERTVVISNTYAADGIDYPPQTWKAGNSRANGKYPVVYSVDSNCGLTVGDKIKQAGIRVLSSSPTVYYLERIEIPELPMYMVGTYYGGSLGEDTSWDKVYTPIEYVPPELPDLVFPPLVIPPATIPSVDPPNIETCGSDPVAKEQITHGAFSLVGDKNTGSSQIISCVCRLRAETNTNPSKITIEGRFQEQETAYSGSVLTSKWKDTARVDFYKVEALDNNKQVVATARLQTKSSATYPANGEKRTGIFDNTSEVDICFLRFVVEKSVYSAGSFTLTADPFSEAVTPFRPTTVEHSNRINDIGKIMQWTKRGTLTWGQTPGGIWIRDVDQVCHSAIGNDLAGWWPYMHQQYKMSGGTESQYSSSKQLVVSVVQHKSASNGVSYKNRYYTDTDHPNVPNNASEGASGISWGYYQWGFGDNNISYIATAAYEPNNSNEFTFDSSIYGVGDLGDYPYSYYLNRILHLRNLEPPPQVNWPYVDIKDSETYIKIKFPGYEHEGHSDRPTKLTLAFAEIENVCGLVLN